MEPIISNRNGELTVSCNTIGAGIGYRYTDTDMHPWVGWRIYSGPISVRKGKELEWIAHRIGFLPSKIKRFRYEL